MTTNDPQRTRALTLVPTTPPLGSPNDPVAPPPERPDPERQERAFALHLAGYRTGQIAEQFHVTTRAVRYWLRDKREEAAKESLAERPNRLTRAIESQRLIAAAWSAYEDLRDRERSAATGQLALHARRILRPADRHITEADPVPGAADLATNRPPADESVIEEYRRPQYSAQIAKLLAIAAAAQREIAQPQGLYGARPQEVERDTPPIIISHQPDAPSDLRPKPLPLAPYPTRNADLDAKAEESGKSSSPSATSQTPMPPTFPADRASAHSSLSIRTVASAPKNSASEPISAPTAILKS